MSFLQRLGRTKMTSMILRESVSVWLNHYILTYEANFTRTENVVTKHTMLQISLKICFYNYLYYLTKLYSKKTSKNSVT